jgi:hypothetical protein
VGRTNGILGSITLKKVEGSLGISKAKKEFLKNEKKVLDRLGFSFIRDSQFTANSKRDS